MSVSEQSMVEKTEMAPPMPIDDTISICSTERHERETARMVPLRITARPALLNISVIASLLDRPRRVSSRYRVSKKSE